MGGVLLLLVVLLLNMSSAGPSGPVSATDPRPQVTESGPSPAEAMAECDRLAATPGDPRRTVAPVADGQFAPAAAVAACRRAVEANPQEARAQFQLGRSLWLSGQNAEAHEQFKNARLAGYPAASLFLGHAYRDGRLPPGDVANLHTAVELYQEAAAAGVEGADLALADARRELDRSVFDKSLFQNGDYMERIYNANYRNLNYPLSFVYYVQGIARGLEDSNVIFIDQACRPLVSRAGLDLITAADGPAAWVGIINSFDPDGNWTPEGFFRALGSQWSRDYLIDQGMRDATILYNEDGRYGCRSEVTRRILGNIMLVIRNNNASPAAN